MKQEPSFFEGPEPVLVYAEQTSQGTGRRAMAPFVAAAAPSNGSAFPAPGLS